MASMAMYDTILPYTLVGRIPASGDAVAGYVGGNSWPDYWTLAQLFPKAQHLSIGGANQRGRCIDCESGFASISDIPHWLKYTADKSNGPPVIYTFASAMSAAIAAAASTGEKFLTWSAHFNYRPHICDPNGCGYPHVDATQWTNTALPGADADQSLIADGAVFFPGSAPPVVTDPHNFNHFATSHPDRGGLKAGPWDLGTGSGKLDERSVVLHYYGAYHRRQFPAEYLEILKVDLAALAGRLARLAIHLDPHADGTANWDPHTYRGERYQRLLHMSQGGKPQ